ncbi:MAG: DapH/DapD/GlmU-related protein [Candidatus Hodarchaeota archaeon]
MSNSLKKGQFSWKWVVILFLLIGEISFYPSLLLGYIFFTEFTINFNKLVDIVITLLFFISNYFLILFLSLAITIFIIFLINLKVPPKLGSYENSIDNVDVYAWRVKNTLRSFSRWLWEMPHLSILRVFYLRRMGIKIGKNVRLGKYILEDDFMEIGDGTFMGKNTIISGHLIDPFKFTVYKTKIGKKCIFGNWTGMVGADIGNNSIVLGNLSNTSVGLNGITCKGNGIYRGMPIKKIGPSNHLSPKQIRNLKKLIKKQEKLNFYESTLSAIINPGIKTKIKLILGKVFITFGGVMFAFLINFLYIFSIIFFGFPTGDILLDALYLTPIPIIFIVSLGFFIAGTGATTRLLMAIHHKSAGQIKEGEYELDDPKLKSWKTVYLWKQFSLDLTHKTPLGYGDTLILQTYLCKINRNVQMTKALVDPEFLNIGIDSQCAAFAIIRSHYIQDRKIIFKRTEIGKNVMIGSLAYIGAGAKIGDNSVVGIGAYIPENAICEPNSLFIGNPARRLPLSLINNQVKK